MNYPNIYDEYFKLSTPELTEIMAGREEIGSKANIARLIYEQRQMEQRHKNEKEQIELQHRLSTELMTKQVKWIKFSAILTATSTLTAAIAAAILTYMLTTSDHVQLPHPEKAQNIQIQNGVSQKVHSSQS